MGQIQSIIDLLVLPDSDVESALLQCKVLARRMDYEPLESWVNLELSGYRDTDQLPDYRVVTSFPRGLYTNGYWKFSSRMVDPLVVGDELYAKMRTLSLKQGIGQLRNHHQQGELSFPLPNFETIVNSIYLSKVDANYSFIGLHLPVPPSSLGSVVSAVRNKLLNFLLDMEKILPNEEDLTNPTVEQKREVAESFVQNFNFYGANNVAIGDRARIMDYSHHVNIEIQAGNASQLINYLRTIGLEDRDISEIEPLLGTIYQGDLSDQQRTSVVDWIRDKGAKAGRALAGGTAAELIVEGLIKYAPDAADFLTSISLG